MRLIGGWIAVLITRVSLWTYPPAFRREMGDQIEKDVRRRAGEFEGVLAPLTLAVWLVRLSVSLGVNAVGVWREARAAPPARHPERQSGSVSWLDVKLGLRMLVKYPGLSVVSVVGMAVAVAIGAGAFTVIHTMMDPTLPLDEGERVVSIQLSDASSPGRPRRQVIHDFALWRRYAESLDNFGAYSTESRTLIIPGGGADLVRVAKMTASGFRLARVAPALGRPLLDEDERPDAPPVVVMAHEDWQQRFHGDPSVIGRTIRLGSTIHTVVGVMPEGFRFPLNHRFWVPFRLDPADFPLGGGPTIFMFGRLAPGVTLAKAEAELAAIRSRASGAFPEATRDLQPHVLPYALPYFDIDSPAMSVIFHAIQLAISLLLVVVAVNVAVLVYARTTTRMGEIAVRRALGASRTRVVTQLFVEGLLLSGIAAALGLGIAAVGLAKTKEFIDVVAANDVPFWVDLNLPSALVVYVVGLALVAGVIVGVIPGLKATGRRVQVGLQRLSSHGSEMHLGTTWTVLIVMQVAIAVAGLPYAIYVAGQSWERGTAEAGYPAEEVLYAFLSPEREEGTPFAGSPEGRRAEEAGFLGRAEELLRRLDAESGVVGATFVEQFPGYERDVRIEAEDGRTRPVRVNRVGCDLFTLLDVPVLAGRGFVDSDLGEDSGTVLVNGVLAEWMGAGTVLGRRIRIVSGRGDPNRESAETGPWLEVAGVVPDFTIETDLDPASDAKLYRPLSLVDAVAGATSIKLALRIRGTSAQSFAGRFREIAAAVDPALQLHDVRSAESHLWASQQVLRLLGLGIAAVTLSVLLLSAAGIYAMMSFTVIRRRREIGIRSALGADARHVLSGIFVNASVQLGTGMLAGLLLSVAVDRAVVGGLLSGERILLLPMVAGVMVLIGLLAALGPARRGLAVQPTEALRED